MAPAPKKIPRRQCVGCREHKPKRELVRIVKSPEGTVGLDFSGKAKSRALERAFSAQVPEEVVSRLEKELIENRAE